jgi:hypothetical protein
MSIRLASYVILPSVLAAGAFALYGTGRAPEATASTAPASSAAIVTGGDLPPSDNGDVLPPNHPPIGSMTSSRRSIPPAADDPPAVAWTVPDTWKAAPSPNTMRVATYRAPGGVDVSVSRAGGETEANIQRWAAQFDDIGREGRVEKTVHGLHVVTVDFAGTYVGGGATMGGPSEPKPDWAMVGAIVDSRGPPYFFKMTGPATAIRAARSSFDHLIESISPM